MGDKISAGGNTIEIKVYRKRKMLGHCANIDIGSSPADSAPIIKQKEPLSISDLHGLLFKSC